MYLISLIRPSLPTMISLATVLLIIVTFLWLSASFKVTVGSYFAWIGQIGMQLVLRAQARRPLYGCELRAAGKPRTAIPVGACSISRNAVSAGSSFSSALAMARSVSEFGIRGIG